MAIAHAKPAPIAPAVAIAVAEAAVAFAPNSKQKQPIPYLLVKQLPKIAVLMLGNVKRSPKKEQGVKETETGVAIAGNMANKIADYGKP